MNRIHELDLQGDITACTQIKNPADMINCIRSKMGYPPVAPPSSGPVIDSNTIQCLKMIMDKHHGDIDNEGTMLLEVNEILSMINETLACMGLKPITLTDFQGCVLGCTDKPAAVDRLTCMQKCLPKITITPPSIPNIDTCEDNCESTTKNMKDRMDCIKKCIPIL